MEDLVKTLQSKLPCKRTDISDSPKDKHYKFCWEGSNKMSLLCDYLLYFTQQQGVTKRCRLSLLTNSALVYESHDAGGWGELRGSQPMSTHHVTWSPNKLWRSISIFNPLLSSLSFLSSQQNKLIDVSRALLIARVERQKNLVLTSKSGNIRRTLAAISVFIRLYCQCHTQMRMKLPHVQRYSGVLFTCRKNDDRIGLRLKAVLKWGRRSHPVYVSQNDILEQRNMPCLPASSHLHRSPSHPCENVLCSAGR